MKSHQIILSGILLLFTLAAPSMSYAQNTRGKQVTEKDIKIQNLVTSGNYVFKAQTALPMKGGTRQLTSDYGLIISKDTIQAYLPYFGRAYSAPIDPSKGGIQFISTQFKYTITGHKKGGWNVSIKPEDVRDVQQLSLSISKNGYASLQVLSTQRQSISFNGYISEK